MLKWSAKWEGNKKGRRHILNSNKNNNNNNNKELYLHDYNNTALQKRGKPDNYSNLVTRVQFQQ